MLALSDHVRRLMPVLVLLAGATHAWAETRSAQMNVSAVVVARTVLTIAAVPAEVVVTETDARRGYVVVPDAFAFQVRSNSLDGYMLRFESVSPQFARISVSWSSTEVLIREGEAQIAQPYRRGVTPYAATVRLDLAPGTQPGRYGWPVRVAAETF